jgi:hypothetical protein
MAVADGDCKREAPTIFLFQEMSHAPEKMGVIIKI